MKLNVIECKMEYILEKEVGLIYSPMEWIDADVDSQLMTLAGLAGLPATTCIDLLDTQSLWKLQQFAELANCAAKCVDYSFYDAKDWCIEAILEFHASSGAVAVGASWGMLEIVVTTPEWGVSSYHCPAMDSEPYKALPRAKAWCGVRRQMASFLIASDARLQRIVAWITQRTCGEDDVLAIRINTLLENWGRKVPLP